MPKLFVHRPRRSTLLLTMLQALVASSLYAQADSYSPAEQTFLSCVARIRSAKADSLADTTFSPFQWRAAQLVLQHPGIGCDLASQELMTRVGRRVTTTASFIAPRPATAGATSPPARCDDCEVTTSQLVDSLHGIRIEHRHGGINGMDLIFTTRIMPCTDTLNIRVQVATSIRDAPLGLRVVNSARTMPGGLCAVSGPLDTLDAGG
jgi:hypothetical protein